MTPDEYVASKKAGVNRRVCTEEDISPSVVNACRIAGLSLSELLDQLNEEDWAAYLVSYLKPRLDPLIIDLLESDTVAIGAIYDPIPDVSITKLENGYAILFSTGMREFVYRLARIIATRFSIGDQCVEGGLHETARLVAEVFWWFQETNIAHGPQYDINDDQMRAASTLAMEAEAFLLCHEIGHMMSDAPGMLDELSGGLHAEGQTAHFDEFAADFFGSILVLGSRDENPPDFAITLQMRYAGIEFVLLIYRCLEQIGLDFSHTHPQAGERLAYIRSAIRRRCADHESWLGLSEIARGIEAIFDNILKILDSPKEHAFYFERKAEELLDDLNRALDECTGDIVPDYVSFHSRAGEIFSRGYPERILKRVAEVSANFFSGAYTEERAEQANELWVRFQQFKLLLSFFHDMPDGAVKTRFLASFDRPVN